MSIFDRIRAFLGLTQDTANIVDDDLFAEFLTKIQHEDGSAVEAAISAQVFTAEQMFALMQDDFIYYYYLDEATDNFIIYTDKERLSRFDIDNLHQLHILNAITQLHKPSWEIANV